MTTGKQDSTAQEQKDTKTKLDKNKTKPDNNTETKGLEGLH